MELCTTQVISNLPTQRRLPTIATARLRSKYCLSLKQAPISRTGRTLHSRLLRFTETLPRATTSEETSSGANQYITEDRDGVVAVEDVPPVEKNVYNETEPVEVSKLESPVDEQGQTFEILDKLNVKFDSEDTYSILLYGGGALVALWLTYAIVAAIDSIPLFPKLMELVGLGYTFWFTTRYLIFKENREELFAKIEELKQQVIGADDD